MDDDTFERHLSAWLVDGRNAASSWVVPSVIDHARRNPHGVPFRVRWSDAMRDVTAVHPRPAASRWAIILASTLLVLALAGIGYIGARGLLVAPQATPTPSPTSSPLASPSATALAFARCPNGSPTGVGPDGPRPDLFSQPYSNTPMDFDTSAHRIIAAVGSPVALWAFDVCTNAWQQLDIDLGAIDPPNMLVYDADQNRVLLDEQVQSSDPYSTARFIVSYDLATGERTQLAQIPRKIRFQAIRRTLTGEIVMLGREGPLMTTYDPRTDTVSEIVQAGDAPPQNALWQTVYDASSDRLVAFVCNLDYCYGSGQPQVPGGPGTFDFDFATGTWSREANPGADDAIGVDPLLGGPQMVYDLVGRQIVAFGADNQLFSTNSATTRVWQRLTQAPDPYEMGRASVVYDPVNSRIVVFTQPLTSQDTELSLAAAFDPATQNSVQLLGAAPVVLPTP
jgi:hypothetical protein